VDEPIGGDYTAAARAHSNIALIKYWGKRDPELNIPAVGSISLTLAALHTDTRVSFRPDLREDEFRLDGRPAPAGRMSAVLDLVRERARMSLRAAVSSANNFPTGAGLASSASGFAALAVAACAAAGIETTERELSILARRGSGSAARSIFGGFVQLHAGQDADGRDSYAEELLAADEWPLSIVVAITDRQRKAVGSSSGMARTAASSPFYPAWLASAPENLADMRRAIAARDLTALGELAEHSCLKLHALLLTATPALIYWNAATVAALHAVRELRGEGVPVYFTIDAGPQLKALCAPEDAEAVAAALARVPGVEETRVSGLGAAAHLTERG
jgi:diphosphomevalonate decarboxylase